MSGFTSDVQTDLIRSDVWAEALKQQLQFELVQTSYIATVPFTDGETFNIPSVGEYSVQNYIENTQIATQALATGNFTFAYDQSKVVGTYVTDKMKKKSKWINNIISTFPKDAGRKIMEAFEANAFAAANAGQTASNTNTINGLHHRLVASGTNQVIALKDINYIATSLTKAGVPNSRRVAIVDPSVEYELNNIFGVNTANYNPEAIGIVTSGISTGMRYIRTLNGIEFYVSHFLPTVASETVDSKTVTNGVANLFFSLEPSALPLIGGFQGSPEFATSRNESWKRDEYYASADFGAKLYRPEGLAILLTATAISR